MRRRPRAGWLAALVVPSFGCALLVGDVEGSRPSPDASAASGSGDTGAGPRIDGTGPRGVEAGSDVAVSTEDASAPDASGKDVASADAAPDGTAHPADTSAPVDAPLAVWQPPLVLATATSPQGLTLLGGSLYWIDNGTTIRSLSSSGGVFSPADAGAVALTLSEQATGALLSNGSVLFARSSVNGEDVFATPPGTQGVVGPSSNFSSDATVIAVSGVTMYIAGVAYNHGCNGANGSPLEIDSSQSAGFGGEVTVTCVRTGGVLPISALAVDGTLVFVGQSSVAPILVQHGLQSADAGIALTSFTPTAQNGVVAMAVEASTLYWATADGVIASEPTSGGAVTTLVTGENAIQELVASGGHLFWTSLGDTTAADGTVSTIPVTGTPSTSPTRIAVSQDTPYGLYAAQPGGVTTVFWTNQGLATGVGSVMKSALASP